jgi:hypothetical protein
MLSAVDEPLLAGGNYSHQLESVAPRLLTVCDALFTSAINDDTEGRKHGKKNQLDQARAKA